MNLVQLQRNGERRVALVNNSRLRLLAAASIYELANTAIGQQQSLTSVIDHADSEEWLDYEQVYNGQSEWRLLPSFDHPADPAHCMVSGTGLTHKKSAENRAAMHSAQSSEVTDSMRMYQLGLEGGTPPPGQIGVQPEWFYKGDGLVLRAHLDPLPVPAYGEDGGEEPEIAGVYIIAASGKPFRVGFTTANEFSDHKMEKRNYLYLAHSKLRCCSIGPELSIDADFLQEIPGTVSIFQGDRVVWQKDIWSGQTNMCHSLENLEHHHFKYETHRRPGDVHIHIFGADAFSFGDGIVLADGDVMEVSFPQLGRPLRNPFAAQTHSAALQKVKSIEE